MFTIYNLINFNLPNSKGPILVAKRSNASACGRWFCGNAVSNLGGGMNVYILVCLCCHVDVTTTS